MEWRIICKSEYTRIPDDSKLVEQLANIDLPLTTIQLTNLKQQVNVIKGFSLTTFPDTFKLDAREIDVLKLVVSVLGPKVSINFSPSSFPLAADPLLLV